MRFAYTYHLTIKVYRAEVFEGSFYVQLPVTFIYIYVYKNIYVGVVSVVMGIG